MMLRVIATAVALAVLASGCGSAQSKQFTAFVARASKLCPEAMKGSGGEAEESDPVAVKEVVALIRANANLPVVRSFRADLTERTRLRDSEGALRHRTPSATQANDPHLRELVRRQVEIWKAERELSGIGACARSPYTNL